MQASELMGDEKTINLILYSLNVNLQGYILRKRIREKSLDFN